MKFYLVSTFLWGFTLIFMYLVGSKLFDLFKSRLFETMFSLIFVVISAACNLLFAISLSELIYQLVIFTITIVLEHLA